ncbi:hypothetical protein ACFOLJ_14095 [Rugamonas sp. CCM 8940]|uniref:hypothetical protein n=1 Tax=Rugamonas sp. CCM 8940 TaxID=2765359 RepID=UPI0018F52B1F|nr:hypothetical protein [Rugamonas sp. CCM 8940]MBJ7311354.1 hypothetical protein [Rugamonas sp. CCM 8940]
MSTPTAAAPAPPLADEQADGNGTDNEDFVGLRAVPDGEPVLHLPHGYQLDQAAIPAAARLAALGQLTRVMARFADQHPDEVLAAERHCAPRDGLLRHADGLHWQQRGGSVGYNSVAGYIDLMRRLRQPRQLGPLRVPALAPFDPRHLGRNLERAIYLPDGSAYFDQQWGQLKQIRRHSGGLVGLACWLAIDALLHVFPGHWQGELATGLQAEWNHLAQRFGDAQRLPRQASLFGAARATTLLQLQAALEAELRRAPPMDSEARELSALLEQLLCLSVGGDSGDIWGMRGFHRVWEAACLGHALAEYGAAQIFTCDDALLSGVAPQQRQQWRTNRHRVFARNGRARRPDLVLRQPDGRFRIIDFKYSAQYNDEGFFKRRPADIDLTAAETQQLDNGRIAIDGDAYKMQQDIANLESYRWLLMQHELRSWDESAVELELWVPARHDEKKTCAWQAFEDGRRLPDSGFQHLSVVYRSSADMLQRYAGDFSLFG